MERIFVEGISSCSPSGVSRSMGSDWPKRDGIEIAAQAFCRPETTTTFLCVEAGARVFKVLAMSSGLENLTICEISGMYVMLSAFACQLIVFIGVRPRSAAR